MNPLLRVSKVPSSLFHLCITQDSQHKFCPWKQVCFSRARCLGLVLRHQWMVQWLLPVSCTHRVYKSTRLVEFLESGSKQLAPKLGNKCLLYLPPPPCDTFFLPLVILEPSGVLMNFLEFSTDTSSLLFQNIIEVPLRLKFSIKFRRAWSDKTMGRAFAL